MSSDLRDATHIFLRVVCCHRQPCCQNPLKEGSVKCISELIYEEIHEVLKNVIHDAMTCMEHSRRKIINAMDIVYALKRQGRTLYGFDG
ncbi:hypothetical protein ZIOFF_042459 [Zingiber officinale]|uniref:Histone H4 n=1 Tax=Zingiber officinale TaxID=94328 RepID=A0A8J5G1R0_ZINOF|nr:hypothetical protein ZIOFF_042459 [Zingiber officinale]